MALPALATPQDLGELLGESIEAEDGRALRLLRSASTLVRNFVDKTWVDAEGDLVETIPDAAIDVTLAVAGRAWLNPTGATQETAGPFSISRPSADIYLTKWEQKTLSSSSVTGKQLGGLKVLTTTRGDSLTGPNPIPALPPSDGHTVYFSE